MSIEAIERVEKNWVYGSDFTEINKVIEDIEDKISHQKSIRNEFLRCVK